MNSFDFIKTQYPDIYKKTQITLALLCILLLINGLIFIFVSKSILENKLKDHESIKILEWSETANNVNTTVPGLIKEAEISEKRAEILTSFREIGIEPETISADTTPVVLPNNKKTLGAKSSISIKGSWPKIVSCIRLLENNITITSVDSCILNIVFGQTTAKIDYIIYYQK